MNKAESLAFLEERLRAIENMSQAEFDERVRESGIRELLNPALSISAKTEDIDTFFEGEMVMDMSYLGSYQVWQNGLIVGSLAQSSELLSDSLLVPASRPFTLPGVPILPVYSSFWGIASAPSFTIGLGLPPTIALNPFKLPEPTSNVKLGECHVNGEKYKDEKSANSIGILALAA